MVPPITDREFRGWSLALMGRRGFVNQNSCRLRTPDGALDGWGAPDLDITTLTLPEIVLRGWSLE